MARKPVIFVTGASKGIGLAIANILLIDFNANVVAFSRTTTPELSALASAHTGSLLILQGDVTDATAVSNAVSSTVDTYQHLDGLVLNAGTLEPMGRIASPDIPLDAWKSSFDVNFFSLIVALRAAIPELRKSDLGGRVVFISSGAATGNTAGWAPYNASKAAMNSLCRTLAQEEPHITCVALRPGAVDTPMQVLLREAGAAHMDSQVHQSFIERYENKKLVKPEDSGYVAASLVLRAPKSLSGQFVSWETDACAEYRRP
ncbi:short-chain dehydrogenase [Amylocystis lapponica]|nr:short-chain dehydrogenase [Amylocystis lapponica]